MTVDPTTLITVLAVALLGIGVVLYRLPVGTCAECGHCRLLKLQQEREIEEKAARFYGIPRCSSCGRFHGPGEDHRG